jgi:hypothetical protein
MTTTGIGNRSKNMHRNSYDNKMATTTTILGIGRSLAGRKKLARTAK